MVFGIPKNIPLYELCKGCVIGKNHQDPFDIDKEWRENGNLELVHSDLCYMNKPSLEGARYNLIFSSIIFPGTLGIFF